jgi:hypothetical protein
MNKTTGLAATSRRQQAKRDDNQLARVKSMPMASLPAVDLPPEFMDAIRDMQDRLTVLESRDPRSMLGKLFGRGSVTALLLAAFLISGTAWAYTGFGAGIKTCENWVAAKEDHYAVAKRARFHGWTSGYLTAYSLWVEQGSGPVSRRDSSKGAWAWIDTYCKENPNKSVATAAELLIQSLVDN